MERPCPLMVEEKSGVAVFRKKCTGHMWAMGGGPDAYLQCSKCGHTWSDGKEPG